MAWCSVNVQYLHAQEGPVRIPGIPLIVLGRIPYRWVGNETTAEGLPQAREKWQTERQYQHFPQGKVPSEWLVFLWIGIISWMDNSVFVVKMDNQRYSITQFGFLHSCCSGIFGKSVLLSANACWFSRYINWIPQRCGSSKSGIASRRN